MADYNRTLAFTYIKVRNRNASGPKRDHAGMPCDIDILPQ